MAVVVNTTLKADTSKAVEEIEKVNDKLKETQKEAKKTGEEISEGMVIGNAAVKQIDKVTGGLASALVKVGKAAKKSGKAMRIALLSTGIGAVVIAVGLLVQYWDEIGEALGFINKDLEKQVALNERNLEITSDQISNLDLRIKLGKKQGKNVDDLIAKRKILVGIQKQQILDSIANLKLQKQELEIDKNKLTIWERISQAFVKTKDQASEITEEEKKAIRLKEKEITDLENRLLNIEIAELPDAVKNKDVKTDPEVEAKAKSIEEITKLEDDYLQSQLEKQTQEENAVYDKYFAQIQAAEDYGLDTTVLEEARQKELQVISDTYAEEAKDKEKKRLEDIQKIVNDATDLSELEKIERDRLAAQTELDLLGATWIEKARIAAYYQGLINDETTKQNKEANEKQKEDDEKLQDAKFRVASQTIDAVSSIGKLFAGENEKNAKIAFKISKAVGIAQAGINTSQAIMKAASETTDLTPTQSLRTANMIAMGVAGAAQIASIAAQKFEGGSDTVPKPSLGGGSQAPAFNVVGASGETQLADAIGSQTQRPARAYVVSNDVTTAQEMDRNIIEGASIG